MKIWETVPGRGAANAKWGRDSKEGDASKTTSKALS